MTMTHTGQPNRLIGETSPYLQQHAYNPVDWYPWGPEALARAQTEDKPSLAQRRLFGLPLVSRHGTRVVRRSRHRRVDE